MKHLLLALATLAAVSGAASAALNPSGDRFASADADNDGYLSREEFGVAFPSLKAGAFDIIDTNRDGKISPEEWRTFFSGHGKPQGATPPGHPVMPEDSRMDEQNGGKQNIALPLLPIPKEPPPTLQQGKAPPKANAPSGGLPLLSPPGK